MSPAWTTTVAYQGGPGANGEAAIATWWNGSARPVPVRTFAALVAAVADGGVDFGVVPVWNSAIGEVRDGCTALASQAARLAPVGEVTIAVRHALLALPGASLGTLRAVGSHAAALAQCGRFLARHPALTPVDAWDTAGAALELAALAGHRELTSPAGHAPWYVAAPVTHGESLAVIANRALAERCGLEVLAEDIQDDAGNATRFAVVRAREAACAW